jgi:hypothetical protein
MASVSEDKSVKGKLIEIKRLLTSFDNPSTNSSVFKRGQRKIKDIVKELDESDLTLDGVPLTRYQIEIKSGGGRGGVFVFNTSLVGKKRWNDDYSGGDDCMFDCGDEECTSRNMKQIYPDKQDFAQGGEYSPPRFLSYVTFISRLILAVDELLKGFKKNKGKRNVTLSSNISRTIGHRGIANSISKYLPGTDMLTDEEFATAYSKARGTKKRGTKKRGAKKRRGTKRRVSKRRGSKKRGSKRR